MAEFFPFPGGPRPFSEAVRVGNLLFVSGQVGVNRATASFPETIEGQTEQAIINLRGILEKHGLTLADVVKMTAIVTDKSQIDGFNATYRQYFAENPPARTLMVVSGLVGAAIMEIEAVAEIKE